MIQPIVAPRLYIAKKITDTIDNGTITIGATGSGAFGFEGTGSLGIACDSAGNIGVVASAGFGAGTPSYSGGLFCTVTNAPSINNLRDTSYQVGGSVLGVGVEGTIFADDRTGKMYAGGTLSLTAGPVPVDLHADTTKSVVVSFNVFETYDSIYETIMGW